MAAADRHGLREKKIFSLFAEACALPVRPESIEKRNPPEPDILCEIKGEGPVAFEMVELIDQNIAQGTNEQIRGQVSQPASHLSISTSGSVVGSQLAAAPRRSAVSADKEDGALRDPDVLILASESCFK